MVNRGFGSPNLHKKQFATMAKSLMSQISLKIWLKNIPKPKALQGPDLQQQDRYKKP